MTKQYSIFETTHIFPIGSFVFTNNNLGIGKVVSFSDSEVEVEYFHSIAKQQRLCLPLTKISVASISPQTRCYVHTEDNWRVGRVHKVVDLQIEVDFPEAQSEYIPIQDIFIRCSLPIENPTDVLAHWGHETVFFYQWRKRFMEGLLTQRNVSQGLHGLLSSSISLLAHQVKAAKVVLEDPIPRYLLADEVGLGKTIEAGIIIRQTLLDHENASILIVTPAALYNQWQQELQDKFHVHQWPGQIDLISTDNISSIARNKKYTLVVIDEAHHIAKWHFSNITQVKKNFTICQEIAHQSPGLLLLSATPALHNEDAFLCMLNLLDPVHFQLNKKEEFANLITKREEIGNVLFTLQEEEPDVIISMALDTLKELFSQDPQINSCLTQLETTLFTTTSNLDSRNDLIRKIRLLISEGYRIHRRIIRNRRNDVWKLQRNKPAKEFAEDERDEGILKVLDEWRLDALKFSERDAHRRLELEHCYFLLLDTMGSSLEFFQIIIDYRLAKQNKQLVEKEIDNEIDIKALGCPLFDTELDLLEDIKSIIRNVEDEPYSRFQLLEGCLQMLESSDRTSKVVIFCSYTWVAEQLFQSLTTSFGKAALCFINKSQSEDVIFNQISIFRESSSHWILLSDRVGEEGLNLQFADTIIHFDLPWSPYRMEQRIGRLDRIGQEKEIRSFVFLGSVEDEMLSPVLPYYCFLQDGLGVFQKSINSLQFTIDSLLPDFKRWLFEEGGNLTKQHINAKIEAIRVEVKAEEKRILSQDMLDVLNNTDNENDAFFTALKDFETDSKQVKSHFEPWIKEALCFKTNTKDQITQYQWSEFTLVPVDILTKKFKNETTFVGTYDRGFASIYQKKLIRMGDPFIDTLSDYFNWDDRGKSYAILRCCHDFDNERFVFKFDFIIEANSNEYNNLSSASPIVKKALERRADAILPPFFLSIFIELGEGIVQDKTLLHYLNKNIYKYDDKNAILGYDYNLTRERLSFLTDTFSQRQWENHCKHAYNTALTYVKNSPDFEIKIQEATEKARLTIVRRAAQLQIHQRHTFSQSTIFLENEREIGLALLHSIQQPSIRVDSCGFYLLSPDRPLK